MGFHSNDPESVQHVLDTSSERLSRSAVIIRESQSLMHRTRQIISESHRLLEQANTAPPRAMETCSLVADEKTISLAEIVSMTRMLFVVLGPNAQRQLQG